MAQQRVTVPTYKPDAQARVGLALAGASGLYDRRSESQECYPNRSHFEPCPSSHQATTTREACNSGHQSVIIDKALRISVPMRRALSFFLPNNGNFSPVCGIIL